MTEYGQTVVLLRDRHRDRIVSEPMPAAQAYALSAQIGNLLNSDPDTGMTVTFPAWGSGPATLTRPAVRGAFTDTWTRKDPVPENPVPEASDTCHRCGHPAGWHKHRAGKCSSAETPRCYCTSYLPATPKAKTPPALPPWYGQVSCEEEDRLLAEQAERQAEPERVPWGEPGDNPTPTLRLRDRDPKPVLLGIAQEDIPAGATIALDPKTGMFTLYRPGAPQ